MKDLTVMSIRVTKFLTRDSKIFYRFLSESKKLPSAWIEIPECPITKLSGTQRLNLIHGLSKEVAKLIDLFVRERPVFKTYKVFFDKEDFLHGSIRRNLDDKSWQDQRLLIEFEDKDLIAEAMRKITSVFN